MKTNTTLEKFARREPVTIDIEALNDNVILNANISKVKALIKEFDNNRKNYVQSLYDIEDTNRTLEKDFESYLKYKTLMKLHRQYKNLAESTLTISVDYIGYQTSNDNKKEKLQHSKYYLEVADSYESDALEVLYKLEKSAHFKKLQDVKAAYEFNKKRCIDNEKRIRKLLMPYSVSTYRIFCTNGTEIVNRVLLPLTANTETMRIQPKELKEVGKITLKKVPIFNEQLCKGLREFRNVSAHHGFKVGDYQTGCSLSNCLRSPTVKKVETFDVPKETLECRKVVIPPIAYHYEAIEKPQFKGLKHVVKSECISEMSPLENFYNVFRRCPNGNHVKCLIMNGGFLNVSEIEKKEFKELAMS